LHQLNREEETSYWVYVHAKKRVKFPLQTCLCEILAEGGGCGLFIGAFSIEALRRFRIGVLMYARHRPAEGYCCLGCDVIYSYRYSEDGGSSISETLINIVTYWWKAGILEAAYTIGS
jgi:hypothetical protein